MKKLLLTSLSLVGGVFGQKMYETDGYIYSEPFYEPFLRVLFAISWVYWIFYNLRNLANYRVPPPTIATYCWYLVMNVLLTPPLISVWIYFKYCRTPNK